MTLASEAVPATGLTGPAPHDWMLHGRVSMGNHPGKLSQILPWSAIFAEPDNQLGTARVELRNLQVYVLSKRTATWTPIQSGPQVWGQLFMMDIATNTAVAPLQIARTTQQDTIGVDGRYMSHFWSLVGRKPIDPRDIAGVYATAEARVNPDDYAAGARYLMDVGVDYWLDADAKWDNFRSNGDAGIGRLKRLTPQWRKFYMTTSKAAYLELCVASGG